MIDELPSEETPRDYVLYNNDLCEEKFQDHNGEGVDEIDRKKPVQLGDLLQQGEVPKEDEIGKAKMEEEDEWRPVPGRGLSVRRRASEQNGIGKVKMKRVEESKTPMSLSVSQMEIQHSINSLTRESSLNSSICTISPITLSILLNDLEFQEGYMDKMVEEVPLTTIDFTSFMDKDDGSSPWKKTIGMQ